MYRKGSLNGQRVNEMVQEKRALMDELKASRAEGNEMKMEMQLSEGFEAAIPKCWFLEIMVDMSSPQ